ncbi:MAG: hypothetical protein F3745_08250 [Nitrospinae bacterium]|nr:hypothetical protein [Nitrospinota bacterium]
MVNTFTSNLKIAVPSKGDLNWENEYSDFAQAVDDIGYLFCFTVTVSSPAVKGVVFYEGFVPQENITVKAVSIYAQNAPTGQDLKVDFLKNGADQNNPGILADGKQFEKTDLSSAIGYLKSDRMGLKFSQVGSNVSGDKIVVTVYYQKEAIKT